MIKDRKTTELFSGLEDNGSLLDDLDDKESLQEEEETVFDEEEYKRWLEEGIKEQKGYGTKDSYEGEIPADDGQSYYNSYRYRDQIRSDTTEAMIVRLKERDNRNALRDRMIAYSLPLGHKIVAPGEKFGLIVRLLVFAFSYVIGIAIGAMLHLDGMDRRLCGGIGIYIGTIIKNNGIDGYTLWDSVVRSSFELCVLLYLAVLWVCAWIGVDIMLPVYLVYFIFFVFAAVFHFHNEYGYDKKMIYYKTLVASGFMLLIILAPIAVNALTQFLFGATVF